MRKNQLLNVHTSCGLALQIFIYLWELKAGGTAYVYVSPEHSYDPAEGHPGQQAYTSTSPTSVSIFSVCYCSMYLYVSFNPSSTQRSRACSLTNRNRCWRGRTDTWMRPGEGWSWRPGHTTYPAGSYKQKPASNYKNISVYGHFTFKFKKRSFFQFSKSRNWAKFRRKVKNSRIKIFT
jgi:hypothetical protein